MEVKDKKAETPDFNVDQILNQAKPKSGGFKKILGAIGRGAANIFLPGLGGVLGGGITSQLLGAVMPGLGTETTQFLALQRQIQQEQLAFETVSTILKVRHDTALTAVRNMK